MADKAAAFRVRAALERRSVGGGKQKALTLVREDRVGRTTGLPVVPPGAPPGI